jgi:hypothetical protein
MAAATVTDLAENAIAPAVSAGAVGWDKDTSKSGPVDAYEGHTQASWRRMFSAQSGL